MQRDLSKAALAKHLARLKLKRIADSLDTILDEAQRASMSPMETLAHALGFEVERREARRVDLGLKIAHFPCVCTLDGFDFSCLPGVGEGRIRELARLDWLAARRNLLLQGPPGVGKTHLAIALGRGAVKAGYSTSFVTAGHLMRQLEEAEAAGRLEQKIVQYLKPKLLVIDELGYMPVKPSTANLFFHLVAARYESGSIMLTTNRPAGEWGIILGDVIVASAVLDRFLHHCEVLTIRGESYRLREARREGVLGAAGAPDDSGTGK
ncbi:MAG: IS21-like element helper ATPase IstB [Desulfovibrio sp.]|nr:IS21-like element helper ATPase IstB [Desulfovibrio sp.]